MQKPSGQARAEFFAWRGMITKHQIRGLVFEFSRTGSMSQSAMKTGMSRKTARKYLHLKDPFAPPRAARTWRTRADPFMEIWAEIEPMLAKAPELEALSLFEHLRTKYPDRFSTGQLRTFQRRVQEWRLLHGPDQEVFFDQQRQPGVTLQIDWTHMEALGITIAGQPYKHLLCHSVLPYSNWQWATRCQSESLLSLRLGLQTALVHLGRVPREVQIDNSSAATHQLHPDGAERGFNPDFLALVEHFDLEPRTINIACPNENGDAESSHGHLKRRIAQHLLLRGSSDFASEAEYDGFLAEILTRANATRADKVSEELKVMRELPATLLPDYEELEVRVSSRSFIRVKNVSYSVPARLIGHRVRVQVTEKEVRVYAGREPICTMPRAFGQQPAVIDFRHVIQELVRKPGAFAGYRYREALFPNVLWRQVYDFLQQTHGLERADKEYLHLLKLAADETQSAVEEVLQERIEAREAFTLKDVRQRLPEAEAATLDLPVPVVDLSGYDLLLDSTTVAAEVPHAA